jgi:hypothetical protein
LPIRRRLAADDVVNVAHGKSFDLDAPLPGIGKAFDAVGGVDQIEVEWPVLELDEVFAAPYLLRFFLRQIERQLPQCGYQCPPVLRGLLNEQVRVLCGIREAQQNGSGLANEEVTTVVPSERIPDLLGLSIVKRAHSPTNRGRSVRTTGGIPPWCRMPETAHRP